MTKFLYGVAAGFLIAVAVVWIEVAWDPWENRPDADGASDVAECYRVESKAWLSEREPEGEKVAFWFTLGDQPGKRALCDFRVGSGVWIQCGTIESSVP